MKPKQPNQDQPAQSKQNRPEWSRVKTRLGTTTIDRLARTRVAIIGMGSLGSQATVLLAMSGVGQFILVDPDVLEPHNVVRHACDSRYIGQIKVEAVADLIRHRNPDAQIETVAQNALDCADRWIDADLIIVAGLGSEIVQQKLGMMIEEHDRPALFGGAYARAEAGEVLLVEQGDDGPCYACFATLLREVEHATTEPVEVDYGLPPDEVKAEPGLGIHVFRIATTLADWAMRLLIADDEVLAAYPFNLVLLANEAYAYGTTMVDGKPVELTMEPSSAKWFNIGRNPDCLICGLEEPTESSAVNIDDLF